MSIVLFVTGWLAPEVTGLLAAALLVAFKVLKPDEAVQGFGSPALRACLHGLAGRTAELLSQSSDFPCLIKDSRLALEVSVIETLAQHLVGLLQVRDPLSERVHLGKIGVAALGLRGITSGLLRRLFRTRSTHHASPTRE